MRAVGLYGQFAGTQFGGDLFVEEAGDNQFQNLFLPLCELIVMRTEVRQPGAFLQCLAILGNRVLNCVQ